MKSIHTLGLSTTEIDNLQDTKIRLFEDFIKVANQWTKRQRTEFCLLTAVLSGSGH